MQHEMSTKYFRICKYEQTSANKRLLPRCQQLTCFLTLTNQQQIRGNMWKFPRMILWPFFYGLRQIICLSSGFIFIGTLLKAPHSCCHRDSHLACAQWNPLLPWGRPLCSLRQVNALPEGTVVLFYLISLIWFQQTDICQGWWACGTFQWLILVEASYCFVYVVHSVQFLFQYHFISAETFHKSQQNYKLY